MISYESTQLNLYWYWWNIRISGNKRPGPIADDLVIHTCIHMHTYAQIHSHIYIYIYIHKWSIHASMYSYKHSIFTCLLHLRNLPFAAKNSSTHSLLACSHFPTKTLRSSVMVLLFWSVCEMLRYNRPMCACESYFGVSSIIKSRLT